MLATVIVRLVLAVRLVPTVRYSNLELDESLLHVVVMELSLHVVVVL